MKDVFVDSPDDVMSRATDSAHVPSPSPAEPHVDGHICPFCGLTRELTDEFDASTPCPRCTLADTPTTRNATKARIGPWHVRQVRNPWAPGMRFETLLALVKRGQVTKDSIVRGPTTHQLWKRASEIKGLSREFGLCHSCGGEIETAANLCRHCNRLQEPPANPDVLVEGREMLAARETASAPAPAREPERLVAKPQAEDEAPRLEIGSVAPPPSEEMLEVTEDAARMARQITARAPVAQPNAPQPPVPPPASSLAPARSKPSRPPRSLRPPPAGSDDALLTPQELAQAFQLNFNPPNQGRRPSRRAVTSGVILLAIGGAALLLIMRPDYRGSAMGWTREKWTGMTSWVSSRTTPAAGPTPREPGRDAAREPAPAAKGKPQAIVIGPAPIVDPKPMDISELTLKETPTTAPALPAVATAPAESALVAVATETSVDAMKLESTVPPAPAAPRTDVPPPPTVVIPPPTLDVTPVAPKNTIPMPTGTPEEQCRTLWGKAIDAEANQDYVEAVQCYELIRTLPKDVQPWGLDVRLEQAKRLAK